MPNSRQTSVMASPSRSRATKRRRSSITELAFHGIHTSRRTKAESVTHVSGTKCHLCLGSLICKLICDGCVADGLGSLRPPWLRSYRLHGAEKIPALAGLQEVLRTKPVGVRAHTSRAQQKRDRCAKSNLCCRKLYNT